MSELINNRLVVKVGTSTLTHEGGTLDLRSFERLARVLSDVQNLGWEVILVSSGAIAVGCGKMRFQSKPSQLRLKQAAAAVGQCELMHLYDKFFGEYSKTVGQILLTGDDVEHPVMRRNLINTFDSLLELGVIPIVNENDSVSFSEIEAEHGKHKVFGDNDTLSAVVAVLCRASKLVLLSDIEGLYDSDPHNDPNARLLPEIRVITPEIEAVAGGAGTARGTGGMVTKLAAARLAMENGTDMTICHGKRPELIYDVIEGRSAGTLFIGRRD